MEYLYAFIAGSSDFISGWLTLRGWADKIQPRYVIALAAGVLLAAAFFHVLPEIDLKAVAKALSVGAGAPQRIVGGGVSTAFAAKTDKEGRLVYPGGMWGRLARGFGISR